MKPNRLIALGLLGFSALNSQLSTLLAQGTAFTYQGRLNDGARPANGVYDLTFALFQNPTGGGALRGPITNSAVSVSNGLFTAMLDFGPFDVDAYGRGRWLEISVRTNGSGPVAILGPRQPMTPAPSAIYASYAGGPPPGGGFNADLLDGFDSSAFWTITGNSGTLAGVHFLGTTDDQPLELKINGARALRLEPDPRGMNAANVVGGHPENSITNGIGGSVIVGGGFPGGPNRVEDNSHGVFIGAGSLNVVRPNSSDAVIAGGFGNGASGYATVVGGGQGNSIQSDATHSVLGGGYLNDIGTNSAYSAIGGGRDNNIAANSPYATISGGRNNTATSHAFAAGTRAKANHTGAFVWADSQDVDFASTANNQFSIRAGGGVRLNTLTEALYIAPAGNIGIGTLAPASKLEVQGAVAAIRLNPDLVAIGSNDDGYELNLVGGVPDGSNMGGQIRLGGSNRGDADINAIQFKQNNSEVMRIHNGGNVGIGTSGPSQKLHVIGNIVASGSVCANNGVNCASDRNVKAGFESVDARAILEKVAALPITRWHYTNDAVTPHLGPVAQDFHAAFAVGSDDKHIATVDADGVALAAIQGLNQKLEQKQTEITELKARLTALEKLVANLNPKGN